jgi:hypothetical protein
MTNRGDISLTMLICIIVFVGAEPYLPASEVNNKRPEVYMPVQYCVMIENANEYDLKKVVVKASYRYGEEWQEMFGLKCRDNQKTHLEYEPVTDEAEIEIIRAVRKAPRRQGIINATFYGTFRASGSPFGDGSYKYKFSVEQIEDITVVSKEGWVPESLSEKSQKRMCQGDELPKASRKNLK